MGLGAGGGIFFFLFLFLFLSFILGGRGRRGGRGTGNYWIDIARNLNTSIRRRGSRRGSVGDQEDGDNVTTGNNENNQLGTTGNNNEQSTNGDNLPVPQRKEYQS
jgi:hypothetical protein